MAAFVFGRETEDSGHYGGVGASAKCCSLFLCGKTGVVDTIHIYWKRSDSSNPVGKAVIYSDNAGEPNALLANGESDEGSIGAGEGAFSWHTFTYTNKPSVSAATSYWIGIHTYGYINYVAYRTDAGGRAYNSDAYPGATDPFGVHTDETAHEMDAHAHCTETGAGATVKKGSSLANTMAMMLNSKMLFNYLPRRF